MFCTYLINDSGATEYLSFTGFPSVSTGFLQALWFPPTSRNMQVGGMPTIKLPLGVNECVVVCVHGVLRWTGVPSRVYSGLRASVPGIGSGSRLWDSILTRLKRLLNMNE